MKWKRWIPVLVLLVMFSSVFTVHGLKTALTVGQLVPDFKLPLIGGGELTLSDVYKVNKLTLVNFWATTCGPCVAEMPDLINLYAKYHASGLELLGVDCGEDPQLVESFADKQGLDFPIMLDPQEHGVAEQYGIEGIPTTIIIDNNGIVKLIWIGMIDMVKFEDVVKTFLGKSAANTQASTTVASFAVGSLVASYPLVSDANDITGANPPMTLLNTPYQDGGIFCNGQYLKSNAETPQINKFNFSAFSIIARFKAGAFPIWPIPVFVGGHGYRWAAFYLEPNGTVTLQYNNSNHVNSKTTYTLNAWHEAAITYQYRTAKLYLDGVLAAKATFTIKHGNNRDVSTTNFGGGTTFKGIFGDLRIYSR